MTYRFKSFLLLSLLSLLISSVFSSCKDEVFPKPKSYLHLEYPIAEYHRFENDCPFSFAISKESTITFGNSCNPIVAYPRLDAKVHFTYQRVQNNLNEILKDVDKLTSKHTVKADAIVPYPFSNKEKNVYGLLNDVKGESASNIQFYLTDSTTHMLTASLYFYREPNYDSIYPAVAYIKDDMMKMMETLQWK